MVKSCPFWSCGRSQHHVALAPGSPGQLEGDGESASKQSHHQGDRETNSPPARIRTLLATQKAGVTAANAKKVAGTFTRKVPATFASFQRHCIACLTRSDVYTCTTAARRFHCAQLRLALVGRIPYLGRCRRPVRVCRTGRTDGRRPF